MSSMANVLMEKEFSELEIYALRFLLLEQQQNKKQKNPKIDNKAKKETELKVEMANQHHLI